MPHVPLAPGPGRSALNVTPGVAPTVRILRDLRELAPVLEAWRALETHPWSDADYYLEHVARQPEFERPHVLVLEREGRPVGLVAGQLRREAVPWRIGNLTLGRSRARVLWVGAGGVMGEVSEATARAIVGAL